MKEQAQPLVTSASSWAKKKVRKIVPVELPSGAVVMICETTLNGLLMADLMPLSLLATTNEKEVKENTDLSSGEQASIMKALKKISEMIARAVVEPKIIFSGEAREGEISADDIPFKDLEFLQSYVLRTEGAEELKDFRNGGSGGDAGQPVQALQPETIDSNMSA